MVLSKQNYSGNGSDDSSSGALSIDSRKLARALRPADTAIWSATKTIALSAIFSLCISSFVGNFVQHVAIAKATKEKEKIEELAKSDLLSAINHIRESYDKKFIEMASDRSVFDAAVEQARKRVGQ